MKHSCVLPFSGFYSTLHDSELDETLNRMFSDRDTGRTVNEDLVMRAWDKMDWRQVHIDYAKEYVDALRGHFGLELEFDELICPREYNFTTDRIFAFISTESLRQVFASVDKDALRLKIHENHTSRDGFISFYPNDLDEWPENVLGWDHNQIGTLLEVFADEGTSGEFGQMEEYDLMEPTRCNGGSDTILYNNCPSMPRLTKIHEYLEHRAHREEVTA